MDNSETAPAQSPAAGPESSAAIDVAHLIKLYKTTRAVDDVSFRIARGSITGLLLSYHQEWPTGPTIVLTLGVCYSVSLLAGAQGIVTTSIRPRRHYQA